MISTETIATRGGLVLRVSKQVGEKDVEIHLCLDARKECILHWGLRQDGQSTWKMPPQDVWPAGTRVAGAALQTPFASQDGQQNIVVRLPRQQGCCALEFVLFFPDRKSWDNNNGRNYRIELSEGNDRAGADLDKEVANFVGQKKPLHQRVFDVEPKGRLAAVLTKDSGRYELTLMSDLPGLLLHWGLSRYSSREWFVPPASLRPSGTVLWEGHTAQTPFASGGGISQLRLEIPEAEAPMGIQFVLKRADGNQWLRYRGGNFFVPIRSDYEQQAQVSSPELAGIANEIIQAEMARNSWTLMHRFNLCHDLLDRVGPSRDGLALLFVWLRYSALRQLTWQRNYNTKPRELSHAQDRLTLKLAQLSRDAGANRPLVRLLLASVAPGGEGQRIRDEILQIMHRHHVKEVTGHFLEEWHQKLHNNTTPDDIVICEAYLEFLYSNGNRERFYQKLQEGGINKQRLESFERPIRSEPDFAPHLKDGLIHDFQNFLRILRSVHAGTDLETSANNARGRLDADTQGLLGRVWEHRRGQIPLVDLVGEITEVRRRLHQRFAGGETARELQYLDLALEQFLRLMVERNAHQAPDGNMLVELIDQVLENRLFSSADAEMDASRRHWQRLKSLPRFGAEWSLHAKSVVDRIARVLGGLIDETYRLLQPKAELLGHAFHAEPWVISLFSEEVVRGSSLDFVLSLLLRNLEPLLRKAARLGNWQIVSRGRGSGLVELATNLREVQGKSFDSPRIIVADHVAGDEEIPDGVTAVIAPDVTDIVSHVAVRARNAGLLFASCYDRETLNRLKAMSGHFVRVEVSPAGDVMVEETAETKVEAPASSRAVRLPFSRPEFRKWVLSEVEFSDELIGGKALNLSRVAGKLPDRVQRPISIVVPFGICERVLAAPQNRKAADTYHQLVAAVEKDPGTSLPRLRETILQLASPGELEAALRETATRAGLPWPENWPEPWHCIKRVWASKWNDRAFYSRRTQGLPHERLLMGVLIQQVAQADYAFVAHTVNPFTSRPEELYAEVVVGLGETLVGNYPGRALSAVCQKNSPAETLLSYPSKSLALRGGGLIFRSDSNGEDLAGFAGAGLYDSVVLPEPKPSLVDYSREPLVWDSEFRHQLLRRVTELGLAAETALGAPQDIEGVVANGKYFLVQARPQVGVIHE